MSTSKMSTRIGMRIAPPPRPVSAPIKPAASAPVRINAVNVSASKRAA
jgi:hypothetical protein